MIKGMRMECVCVSGEVESLGKAEISTMLSVISSTITSYCITNDEANVTYFVVLILT